MALKHAVEKGILQVNLTDAVKPPRLESTEFEVPSLEEVQHILDLADSTPYGSVLSFIVRTGCRRGEALGLEWRHLDLEHGTASICGGEVVGRQGFRTLDTRIKSCTVPVLACIGQSLTVREHFVTKIRESRRHHPTPSCPLGYTALRGRVMRGDVQST